MNTTKNEVTILLQTFSDDVSFDDTHYHLYVLEKVNGGIEQTETEGTISH